tara:strand:+ start:80 stop:520 length:441 start_codon:yes stop_codon:yes gene_type:complete
MRIAVGNDHGGLELADACRDWLQASGYTIIDCGTNDHVSVDYPLYAKRVTELITNGEAEYGLLVCGTGIGVSIVANRQKGIRCGLCTEVTMAKLTRQHNDANILAMGGRITGIGSGLDILKTFLDTAFEGGRHQSRINQIDMEHVL